MENENLQEQILLASAAEGDKGESNSYGKFRTGQDLLNAYNALEAEFTRRSQRIKELEGALSEKTENEKWAEKVKSLNEKYPVARKLEKELTGYLRSNEALLTEDNCLEQALLHVLAERYGARENESMSKGESGVGTEGDSAAVAKSVDTANFLPDVAEVAKLSVPITPKIAAGGGEIPIVPSFRPSSVREAGNLAVEQFKKAKGE